MTRPRRLRFHLRGLHLRRLRPRPGLRSTLSLAFAALAVLVAVLIGALGYHAAARLIRDDEKSDFATALQSVGSQVGRQTLYPGDFNGPTGLNEQLLRPIRVTAQALDAGGAVLPGAAHVALPGAPEDQDLARASASARTVIGVRHLGDETYRVGVVSLGGGRGAVQVVQETGDVEDLLYALRGQMVAVVGAVALLAGAAGWLVARRITGRLVRLTD
ncbi:two-component sensor histidine kinase, partial [Kitasatospora sp. NPDC093558]